MDVALKSAHPILCYWECAIMLSCFVLFCFLPFGGKKIKVLAHALVFGVDTDLSFCLHHGPGRRQRSLT